MKRNKKIIIQTLNTFSFTKPEVEWRTMGHTVLVSDLISRNSAKRRGIVSEEVHKNLKYSVYIELSESSLWARIVD